MEPAPSAEMAARCSAAEGSADVVIDTSAFLASNESSSAQSFPRAGGSRDGHCPYDVKQVGYVEAESANVIQTVVQAKLKNVVDAVPFSPMVAQARVATKISTPLHQLLRTRGIYNVRKAPPAVAQALLGSHKCSATEAVFNLVGENSMQVRRKLNKQLAFELANGTHGAAFTALYGLQDCPRADDIEAMIDSFPAWDNICLLYTSPSPRD